MRKVITLNKAITHNKDITRNNKGNRGIKKNTGFLSNATLWTVTLLVCTALILTSIPIISFAEEIAFSKFAYQAMNSWTKVPNKGHLKITTEIICTAGGYDIEFSLEEDSKTNTVQVKRITGYIFDEQKMVDTFFIKDTPKIETSSQITLTPVYLNAPVHYWVGLEVETNDGQVFRYIRQLPENADITSTGMVYSEINDHDSGDADDNSSSYQEQLSNDEELDAVADDTETEDNETEDTEIDDTVSYDAETVNTQADDTETQDNTESIDAEPYEE